VERAAESVLGNEADALRAARAEVDALKDELQREIARARPDLAQTETAAEDKGKSAAADGRKESDRSSESGRPDAAQKGGSPKPGTDGKEAPGQTPKGDQKGQASGEGKGQQEGEEGKGGKDSPGSQTAEDGKGSGKGKPGQTAQAGSPQSGDAGQPAGASTDGAAGNASPAAQRGGKRGDHGSTAAERNPGTDGRRGANRLRQLANHAGENSGIGGASAGGGGGAATEFDGPMTGDRFVEWSDRLRNVEEMVDDPNLRAEIARIRETAKGVRVDYKRNGVEPKWDMVKMKIGNPLAELHNRITEELARRESKESLVPLDRDPVPPKYVERVRRYYEELGRSH
jgi:hypothetical protein